MAKRAPSARQQALAILTEVLDQGAFSNLALQSQLRGASSQDAGLAKQLVFGTVTYRASLDYLLQQWLNRPLADLDSRIRNILRLGLYQVIYLQVPDHAAVSESVNLARQVSHAGSAGLVNAVLRRAVRERQQLPWPNSGDHVFDLAIRYSFPEWLVARWLDRFGPAEAEDWCRAQNRAPGIDLRVNSLRSTVEGLLAELNAAGVQAVAHQLVPDSLHLAGGSLPSLPALQNGSCTVQGAASTLVGLVVDPDPGQLAYDICAAPGGKALHLAELMKDEGRVIAVDNHAGRLRLITQAARRLQIETVQPELADATALSELAWMQAPRVLVDAPCSGLGVIRRKPDIRWHRSPSDLTSLAELQLQILQQAAQLVQPGGILVYSVCSTEPEETQQVVQRFRGQHPEFIPADWPNRLQSLFGDELRDGGLTTYPHRHDLDGFFICRLHRLA